MEIQIRFGPADLTRCVAWIAVLKSVLLSDEDSVALRMSNTESDAGLPCSEGLWSTTDSTSWRNLPEATIPSTECFQKLLSGAPLSAGISSFGLLTLISGILSRICTRRLDNGVLKSPPGPHDEEALQRALQMWEDAWRAHPHSSSAPESAQGPLMADSLALLNMAYYRLYASVELTEMKSIIRAPTHQVSTAQVERLYCLGNHPGLVKAVVRACRCILVRVRLGIGYILKTGSVTYPFYSPWAAYEGCRFILD